MIIHNRLARLLERALITKWQLKSVRYVHEACNFCFDALERNHGQHEDKCGVCICPKNICSNGGSTGLLSEYPNIKVCDLPKADLDRIVGQFRVALAAAWARGTGHHQTAVESGP